MQLRKFQPELPNMRSNLSFNCMVTALGGFMRNSKPSRLKAELHTGAVCGCTPPKTNHGSFVDKSFIGYQFLYLKALS